MRRVKITGSSITITSPISISNGVCYSIPAGAGLAWCSGNIYNTTINLWQTQATQNNTWIDWYHSVLAIGYT